MQKLDRTIPKIERWRPKYGLIYADLYGADPSPDKMVMQKKDNIGHPKRILKKRHDKSDFAEIRSQLYA